MALLPNEIYDDIVKFVKISSYKDFALTSRRMRRIMDPFMRCQKIQITKARVEAKLFCKNLLQSEYQRCHYLTKSRRQELAKKTNLSAKQVKVWFQNRRAKIKAQKMRKLASE